MPAPTLSVSTSASRRLVLAGALATLLSPLQPLLAQPSAFDYRVLATNRTSTMEKELQQAADAGFEYVGQTVFKSVFGGEEVVCILERDKDNSGATPSYRLLATTRTGTLQKELSEIGAAGYEVLGMTVGKTAMGGKELVAIARRPASAAR